MKDIDQMLQDAIAGLVELDTFLSITLEYIVRINDSFNSISICYGKLRDPALSFLDNNRNLYNVTKKEDLSIMGQRATLSESLEISLKKLNNFYKDNPKEQVSDQLLKIRQNIAVDKCESLKQALEMSVKNVSYFESLVKFHAEQTYLIDQMEDLSLQKKRMASLMNQYRMSYYIYLSLSLLFDEYNAWMGGEHNLKKDLPTLLDVNKHIVNIVLFSKDNPLVSIDKEWGEIKKENPNVTGRVFFLIIDNGLMSFYLLQQKNIISFIQKLKGGAISNAKIKTLLLVNLAFGKTLDACNQYQKKIAEGAGTTPIYIVSVFLTFLIAVGSFYCEEVWLKVLFLIIGFGIMISFTRKRLKNAKLKFQSTLDTTLFQMNHYMLLYVGDIPKKKKQ